MSHTDNINIHEKNKYLFIIYVDNTVVRVCIDSPNMLQALSIFSLTFGDSCLLKVESITLV